MLCHRPSCPNDAVGAIALNIPATGCPIKEHDPIRLVLGVQLCAACTAKAKVADYVNVGASDKLREIVAVLSRGMAPPDWQRAFLSPVSFDSQEWRILTRGRPPTP